MSLNCEKGLCISFKKPKGIVVGTNNGKPIAFTLNPQDYIDLDVNSGEFFVVNKFTGAKMKMIKADSELHFFEKRRIPSFIKASKSSDGFSFWGKDSKLIDKF